MPQLDFITNLNLVQCFLILILLGVVYLNDYLNDVVLSFNETVFNFFHQSPKFFKLLTYKIAPLY